MLQVDNRYRSLQNAEKQGDGVHVIFVDGQAGVIPWRDVPGITSSDEVQGVKHNADVIWIATRGGTIELPWDFARHYADRGFQAREEAIARESRRVLGQRVKQARKSAGLTQERLAQAAGIKRVTLARIEAGENSPRFETLQAIARGLGLPVERLLTDG